MLFDIFRIFVHFYDTFRTQDVINLQILLRLIFHVQKSQIVLASALSFGLAKVHNFRKKYVKATSLVLDLVLVQFMRPKLRYVIVNLVKFGEIRNFCSLRDFARVPYFGSVNIISVFGFRSLNNLIECFLSYS